MNQVDKELMQEKGILTENEKADEYEIQKAAMKEAVFFLAAMLEKNLDMSELQTISLYLKELSMKQHYMHIHLYVQQLYLYEYCGLVEKSPDIATEVNEKESAANHKEVQSEAVTVKNSDRSAGEKKKSIHDRLKENKEKLGQKSGKDNPQKGVELT